MNMQDMMVFRDTGRRTVDKYLMPHEGHIIAVRRHPAVLLLPVLGVVGGLVLVGAVSTVTRTAWIWWTWLLLLGWLMWKIFAWSIEFFLITEYRLMVVTGVLNRKVAMMPLAKVEDVKLERSLIGQMLCYGEFISESAGQKQALRNVDHMPYPEQLYLEASSLIFGAEDESPD